MILLDADVLLIDIRYQNDPKYAVNRRALDRLAADGAALGVTSQTLLEVIGILPTLYDSRTQHAQEILDDVGRRYRLPVLQPPIRKSIRFAEAPRSGRSIIKFAPSHAGADSYRQIARSLLDAANAATQHHDAAGN